MNHIIKLSPTPIRRLSGIDERVVQELIAQDPTILGLGDLALKDKERNQARAGRLDLLLQDNADNPRRYEVEIQLGATDESHIIRTLEYWDIERKRYPQYDHCAVIVAEEITSRFSNVIGLFNGYIPLIAIQMNTYRIDDKIGISFTKVLDELTLGPVDEDESTYEAADRDYWLSRATKATVSMTDKILKIVESISPEYSLNYNKHYIGLKFNGQSRNFVSCKPQKSTVVLNLRLRKSEEIDAQIQEAKFDEMTYDNRFKQYRLRLTQGEIDEKKDVLQELIRIAEEQYNR